MLTPENIAFLDSVLLRAVTETGPADYREIFHRFIDLTGPESEIVEDVRMQNMLLTEVAREYNVGERLDAFADEGKTVTVVFTVPAKSQYTYYAIGGTTLHIEGMIPEAVGFA